MRLPFELKTIANTYQPEAFISGIVFFPAGESICRTFYLIILEQYIIAMRRYCLDII